MSFGKNLINQRKRIGITQEELAERLHVSRQTVSRWETDITTPDVDILIALGDVFGCSIDELVRGKNDAEGGAAAEPTATPEPSIGAGERRRHFRGFALAIAGGVAIILFAVAAMLFIYPASEVWSVVTLLVLVAAAVALFVFAGIRHSLFLKENPVLPKYPEELSHRFLKRTPFIFAAAVALIIIGVALLIVMSTLLGFDESEAEEMLAVGIFMLIVGASSATFTYTGMECSDLSEGKFKDLDDDDGEGLSPKGRRINEALSTAIMLCATAAFLLLGFTAGLWHPAWVVFPIGAVLSGIITSVLKAVYPADGAKSGENK